MPSEEKRGEVRVKIEMVPECRPTPENLTRFRATLRGEDDDSVPCSFCGKPRREVRWLVEAAGTGVRICNECVTEVVPVHGRCGEHVIWRWKLALAARILFWTAAAAMTVCRGEAW